MFKDRKDAANQLGAALEKYRVPNPVIVAIPRGGVEVGFHIARYLDSEFDILISRKLSYLYQPESAFGAIAEDGSLYLNPWNDKFLSQTMIGSVSAKERDEISRRITKYRDGRPLKSLENRIVILVDDGIATGATLWAAIRMCKNRNPRKLIVAAPVVPSDVKQRMLREVSGLVTLETLSDYVSVSQVYEHFENLTDSDVIHFIRKWKKHQKNSGTVQV